MKDEQDTSVEWEGFWRPPR